MAMIPQESAKIESALQALASPICMVGHDEATQRRHQSLGTAGDGRGRRSVIAGNRPRRPRGLYGRR